MLKMLTLYTNANRECQKRDWKSEAGPHKEICGKPYPNKNHTLPEKNQLGSVGSPQKVPDRDPTFSRSPALLYQIRLIEKNTSDYSVSHNILQSVSSTINASFSLS